MSKALAVLIAGLLGAGVCAPVQAQNPSGVSPEQGNATNSKSQQRAETRKSSRPAGQVKAPTDDTSKTPEGGTFGADKAGVAGEKRAETRDDRRRNKDGTLKRRSTQGGTPQ